ESGMVTRAVENAQKKVESMHFESRKHLLEYDDVANEQRKVIYTFRNDLLNEDYAIAAKIDENIKEFAAVLIENAKELSDSIMPEDFSYENVIVKAKEELNIDITQEQIQADDFDTIEEKLVNLLKEKYEDKMSMPAPEQRSEIERILYLQVLDKAYREHLYSMDTLKTGIGLRGYNQKDPLVEYKKESYNMFIELIASIKYEIIRILFSVQLRDEDEARREQEALERLKKEMEATVEDISLNTNDVKQVIEKKVARNSPCPCGSGKKYKQCCGQSGPKKGILAR
ncbi:MAG: SEC-C metal-binding domain-containing protein, partial [Arcobacteraceae bacterium]